MVVTDDCADAVDTRELLRLACEGEPEAFCQLVRPHQARLLRQALALCGEQTTAEDLVCEALVEAWRCLRTYNQTCRFTTWLYAILLHRYQKSLRRARSRPIPLATLPAAQAATHEARHQEVPSDIALPFELLARHERARKLSQLVDLLPEKHRQVILLRFFEDASLADMATVLNCSIGTVKSRLHHALEKLRRMNLDELKGDT